MSVTLALAGDTMLGRLVGDRLATAPFGSIVDPAVREITAAADLFVLNLECCVSARGAPWRLPGKPFFFRAPPRAAELLGWLGVGCVTLANNHALDYGPLALRDTRVHLADAGVLSVGAGVDVETARAWRTLEAGGLEIAVIGVTDHPAEFAADHDGPGVAYAELRRGVPAWLRDQVATAAERADLAVVTPHWGPNMTSKPPAYVRAAARGLTEAGAGLVAGHSAHVFHGVSGTVLFDLGEFVDDYAVDERLRNDLGLLFLVTLDDDGPERLEVVPLAVGFCHTRLAEPAEAAWLCRRFVRACAELGTEAQLTGQGRVTVRLR